MAAIDRPALRAAGHICGQLAQAGHPAEAVCLPDSAWQRVKRFARQLDRATEHRWPGAGRRAREMLCEAVADCSGQLKGLLGQLEAPRPARPDLREVYYDLLALELEFPEVEIELAQQTVSVTTERIVLDSVELGPFQIILDWQRLPAPQGYRIAALEPRPAASRDTVTHPHVQDERLCAGDGHVPIQAALAEGRLLDFFLLVAQVLHTYAQGNAYVELDHWDGVPCQDCGVLADPEHSSRCQHCEALVCSDCVGDCEGCGEVLCGACLDPCPHCQTAVCSVCRARCRQCAREACTCCLDENALCQECHDAKATPSEESPAPRPAAASKPAARGP